MNAQVDEIVSSPLDWLKWALVWILMIGIIIGNFYLSDQSIPLRVAGSLIIGMVALALASFTAKGKRFWIFAKEARVELRKVAWPTRQETIQSTIMIVVVVIIMGLLLWGIDSLLLWIIGFFTGQRG